jgi:hypothetical protein
MFSFDRLGGALRVRAGENSLSTAICEACVLAEDGVQASI